jgi:hypothetical protein
MFRFKLPVAIPNSIAAHDVNECTAWCTDNVPLDGRVGCYQQCFMRYLQYQLCKTEGHARLPIPLEECGLSCAKPCAKSAIPSSNTDEFGHAAPH